MKSTKRRNRSTERTKKGVSAGDRASVSEYWSICVSKVSFGIGSTLGVGRAGVICFPVKTAILDSGLYVNDDKETSYLWARLLAPWAACCGAGGEDGAAQSRDGAEGGIPPGGLCRLPLERRARPVSLGTGVMCHSSTELPLWALVCPHFHTHKC